MAENAQQKSSYAPILERMNNIMGQFAGLPLDSVYNVFSRAWANQPQIQNSRIKALNPLPCDFTKQELNEFLLSPQNSETQLQQVGEGLKWTNYSWFKIIKSYADMLQFHCLILPQNVTAEEIKSEAFKREFRLVNKVKKSLKAREVGRKTAKQAEAQGKVFYVPRYSVDKSHNKCNYFFMQQLPSKWCTIIGQNSLSGWTISFNLMYFYTMGTDYRQFGDLFEPYMNDFNEWITADSRKAFRCKYVYASRNNAERMETEVKAWYQNGRWMYYVSLPIDRVWTFDIDDSTAIVASPFSGLMQTFAQQADYEAAQLSLVLNPLIKIFTGEIPYYQSTGAKEDDGFRLSIGARALFEAYFDQLMARTNTAGVGLYTAPVENIKSHDFAEAAGANDVSKKFLDYGMAKSGVQSLIPITDRPTEEAIKAAEKLEPQFAQHIYRTFENMMNHIFDSLNLQFEWRVHFFGDVYSDAQVRADALKQIDKGDISAWAIICALDDMSILEKVSLGETIKSSGFIELLQPPQLSYTQSNKSTVTPIKETGAPTKTEQEKQEYSTISDGDESDG